MARNRLRPLLAGHNALIDGGQGWLLAERGLPPGEVAERWNLENPDGIATLMREYATAGAQVLTTSTFGGTRPRMELAGLGDWVAQANQAGARIAKEVAIEYGALVAGDLGPTGELLEPLGTLSPERAQELYAEQISALVAGGVDLILIETMSDLAEAKAAVAAAQAVAPELPVAVTFSFDTNLHTMMGVDPGMAVREMAALGVDAVGANCGRGPEEMSAIADQLVAARDALDSDNPPMLIAQSNAGLPQLEGDGFVYTVGPEELGEHAAELRAKGIDIVGSCCGSSPAHTAAIAARLT